MTGAEEPTATAELLRHGNWVQAVAYAVVRDHQLAEDVRQEVFLAALEGKWSGAMLRKRWLSATSKNRALNIIRGRSRAEARDSKKPPTPPPANPSEIVEAIDAQKKILAALEVLSPKGKKVIYLRFFHSWTFAQIGKELGISEGAARVQTHRLLAMLRKKLEHKREDWLQCCMAAIGIRSLPKLAGALTGSIAAAAAVGILAVILNFPSTLALVGDGYSMEHSDALQVAEAKVEDQSQSEQSLDRVLHRQEIPRVAEPSHREAAPFPDPEAGFETIRGIVVHNRLPYPDAEIKVIHAGRYWTTRSDPKGKFVLEVYKNVSFTAVVYENGLYGQSNSFDGLVRIDLFELKDPSIFHLKIVDDETKKPMVGVAVDFIVAIGYWTGGHIQDLRHGLTLGSGISDHEGKVSMKDYPFHMTLAAKIDHPGFQTWLGNIHIWPSGGLAKLRKSGKGKSVQVNNSQGVGIEGAVVWAGYASKVGKKTDANGFIANHELLYRGSDKAIRTDEVVVQLPSGRFWSAGGWLSSGKQRPGCKSSEDRIEIEVNDAPIQVNFASPGGIPEGLKIEVARMDKRHAFHRDIVRRTVPIVVGNGITYRWHPVSNHQSTLIVDGCVGPDSWIVARDAKNKSYLGSAKVDGDQCTLDLKLAQVSVNLPPPPCSMDHEWVLHLEPENRGNLGIGDLTVIQAINGVFDGWVPQNEYRMFIAHRDGWGKSKLDHQFRVHEERSQPVTIGPNGLFGTIQPPTYEFYPVQLRINGIPSLGGWVVGNPIELDGMMAMKCNAKGEGLVRWIRFITPGELLTPPNGPVVSRGFLPSSGAVIPLTDGYPKVWDIRLATVELNLTSLPVQRKTKIDLQPLPQKANGDHADIPLDFSRDGLQGDITGRLGIGTSPILALPGEVTCKFQIPAGRYRFKIGDHWYTAKGGIELKGGGLYQLNPQIAD